MKYGGVKLGLMLVLFIHHILVTGQVKTEWADVARDSKTDQYLEFAISQLATYEGALNVGIEGLCPKTCPSKTYFGITHVPSEDFNIYLTFYNSVTPVIQASFEVSLNYAGVMNIRSIISLRKKERRSGI